MGDSLLRPFGHTPMSLSLSSLNGALLLGLALATAASPSPAMAQGDAGRRLPIDTAVTVGTLDNGLTYYIRENNEPRNRAELRLVVNAGSVLEDADQLGLAHFVEHMAFNGTQSFEEHQLVDYLESVGMRFGPDINAYTSFDETVYMLTVPTDTPRVLETGMQILEEWAHLLAFDSLEIEKERGVVLEEWRLGQGAASRMRDKQFPVLMQNSRYAERLPIGTPRSIRTFDPAALRRFYNDWYRPDLMAVVAVGDFDAALMEARIKEHFADLPMPESPRPRREFTVAPHDETLISIATDPEATNSTVTLYMKQRPNVWTTDAAYRNWIVESLAGGMFTNRLSELTQRPESPFVDVSSFHGRFIRPLSAYILTIRVPDGGIATGLAALLKESQRVQQHGFTATELEREKEQLLRVMEKRYRERDNVRSSGFAAEYTSHFLYGGTLVDMETEFDLYSRFLPEITVAEVNSAAERWTQESNRVVTVSAPPRDSASVPTAEELQEVIQAAGDLRLAAYADSLSSEPLISDPPEPGVIVAEDSIPEIGTLRWTLDNGVEVILKPTDFKEDEVLLAARSPGGTSLIPDDDYIAALTATAVTQVAGIGQLDAIELRKRLAGKVVGVGADIGQLHEGVSGASSRRDLETLFKLVYLKFTAPRVDTAAFLAYQQHAQAALENRLASPEVLFADTVRVTLTQDHPRAQPPTSAMFNKLDLHRSLEIYRARFADAGDFTFYIVGSFDPQEIRPLVLRYLGSLPSTRGTESWKDVGIRAPDGVVTRTVYKGLEPKARTQIVFHGPLDFSLDRLYELNALAGVMRIRLRESLREDLGGTYGVQVSASGWRDPRPEYRVSVGFGAEPDRLEELTRVAFAQMDSLKVNGPSAADILKVREIQLRSRQTDLRENHFWISQLMVYDRYGWDPREIDDYDQWLATLDAATIQAAAVRFLDTSQYVRVSLYPEDWRAPVAVH
ncbi:MAG TPA: insulinase family protein [Longimicrobiaceae bacterium]|nr:insulinase family protein [Longimicrobiaceae bacterium]